MNERDAQQASFEQLEQEQAARLRRETKILWFIVGSLYLIAGLIYLLDIFYPIGVN